jgi:hypothetical protein
MLKSILVASGLSLAAVSIAGAVTPVAKPGATTSDVIQVKKHWKDDDWRWKKKKHWRGNNYYGHHYRHHPPRGWNRYDRRPWGWQRRGCVVVGPVWYCP